jgi:hypothetical protein
VKSKDMATNSLIKCSERIARTAVRGNYRVNGPIPFSTQRFFSDAVRGGEQGPRTSNTYPFPANPSADSIDKTTVAMVDEGSHSSIDESQIQEEWLAMERRVSRRKPKQKGKIPRLLSLLVI